MKAQGSYLERAYGPAEQKTFHGALISFFTREFPQLAGDRARQAVVTELVRLVHKFFPETSHLRPGQTTWTTV